MSLGCLRENSEGNGLNDQEHGNLLKLLSVKALEEIEFDGEYYTVGAVEIDGCISVTVTAKNGGVSVFSYVVQSRCVVSQTGEDISRFRDFLQRYNVLTLSGEILDRSTLNRMMALRGAIRKMRYLERDFLVSIDESSWRVFSVFVVCGNMAIGSFLLRLEDNMIVNPNGDVGLVKSIICNGVQMMTDTSTSGSGSGSGAYNR